MRIHTTFSMEEAAAVLRCSRFTLRDWVTRGEVPHHRTGRRKGIYFTQEDLDVILASQARPMSVSGSRAVRTAQEPPVKLSDIPAEFAALRRAPQP